MSINNKPAISISLVLIFAGWFLATFHPFLTGDKAELMSLSVGYLFLANGALPWFLQFAGLAILLSLIGRKVISANRGVLFCGIAIPLSWGHIWWIALIATNWQMNLMERITDQIVQEETNFLFGPQADFQTFLRRSAGMVVNPFALFRAGTGDGWKFHWMGISTTLVITYWMLAAKWIGISEEFGSLELPSWKEFLKMTAAVVIYVSPIAVSELIE